MNNPYYQYLLGFLEGDKKIQPEKKSHEVDTLDDTIENTRPLIKPYDQQNDNNIQEKTLIFAPAPTKIDINSKSSLIKKSVVQKNPKRVHVKIDNKKDNKFQTNNNKPIKLTEKKAIVKHYTPILKKYPALAKFKK